MVCGLSPVKGDVLKMEARDSTDIEEMTKETGAS
jgi:hypothetical protein